MLMLRPRRGLRDSMACHRVPGQNARAAAANMRAVRRDAWLRAAALACAAWLCRAGAAGPEPVPTPIARSALVTLEAADTAQGLKLRVQRTTDHGALSLSGLTVSIDSRGPPAP